MALRRKHMDFQPLLFDGRAFELFDAEEITEPLLMLYRQLSLALREKADTIQLNEKELLQIANGLPTKRISMIYEGMSIYATVRKNLFLLFERDDLVKQHFRLTRTDSHELVVEVIKSKS
jgi:hypothetical protein